MAGPDGQVKVWNVVLGRLDHAFRAARRLGGRRGVQPGRQLGSPPLGQDDKVRIWDLALEPPPGSANPVPSQVISAESGGIFGVAWSADGKRLATAGKDGTVRIWDLSHSPPRNPLIFRGHEGEVLCVAFHPDGSLIASGGADRHVRIWDAATGAAAQQFPRGRQSRECDRLQPGWQVAGDGKPRRPDRHLG